MAERFAKYSAQHFAKKLDKFKSKVGTVKIRNLVVGRAPYDLPKFKIAEVKEL